MTDIILTSKRRYRPLLTGETGAFSPQRLATGIPGGASVFDRIRILKVTAYAAAGANTYVQVTFADDQSQFEDFGTQGAMRPALHLMPPFETRQFWYPTTDTNSVFTVSTTGTTPDFIVDVTMEFRSISQVAPAAASSQFVLPSPRPQPSLDSLHQERVEDLGA